MNHMLELDQQMILGNYPSQTSSGSVMFDVNISQDVLSYPKQLDVNFGNDERRRNHSSEESEKQR
ncbi:hypothetical protein ALC53_01773 [Atta colombica]|uniref:Uncharacterized protein n=1 Tax=Atta colombica TaxID=520822 RepID=A0A151I5R1_9HYME|nr:hypothetical protein ALC53_01773 [Atta colombica]